MVNILKNLKRLFGNMLFQHKNRIHLGYGLLFVISHVGEQMP
ncbi:hypothetical protein HMPREF0519_2303 [Lentilactobacillus hilgardii DSM 20176 = ATCC 8290]|uniref:Uncharacterized protein n=1 Tax=Lentilactobacillus hilgardii (strain ATCC 8290 / DSM 20176 / CCUG 30140 / JCM 1155 / KCTC 3500 / NBRC 15886 / NCIMB 8040 / NRRL B-1843 / 9) TaxID=1423757 RepID=C0XM42_LENH9|nr:hypothetical protein HMPREF0519_2303 [Lentilactobacillus hilgardii DSM 20176 = ATCC 8290]